MSRFRVAPALLAAVLLAACGRESPTAVGGNLLTGGDIRSFELTLDASQFLQFDTTASGFVTVTSTAFRMVEQAWDGTVYAHTLARFALPPTSITVRDTAGGTLTDTLPKYFAGKVVVHLDTTADNGPAPVALQLYRTTQEWDAGSATWTLAVDSGSVHAPWATAGGTVGTLVDTATWQPGMDSVTFHVDSGTVAAWRDTTNLGRGALITAVTAGTRLRADSVTYNIQAHSTLRPDTTVTVSPNTLASTFIYTPAPPPPPPGVLRFGGVPAWRSYLTFVPDLVTRTLACPPEAGAPCAFTLQHATVNYAALLLHPAPTAPFEPIDSVRAAAFVVDTSSLIPLVRSPLGPSVGGTAPALVPSLFYGTPPDTGFAVPITNFIAALSGDTLLIGSASAASHTIAILHLPEPGLLGYGAFYGRTAGAALAPRLRIVVTLAPEVQLP